MAINNIGYSMREKGSGVGCLFSFIFICLAIGFCAQFKNSIISLITVEGLVYSLAILSVYSFIRLDWIAYLLTEFTGGSQVHAKTGLRIYTILGSIILIPISIFFLVDAFAVTKPISSPAQGLVLPRILIVLACLLYAGAILPGLYLSSLEKSNNFSKALFFILGSICLLFTNKSLPSINDSLVDSASRVCLGEKLDNARPFNPSSTLNPIVIVDADGGRHVYTDRIPVEWWPKATKDIVLVGCVGEEKKELIQTCNFTNGPSVSRYQYFAEVKLMEASSGRLVDSHIVHGSPPRECHESEDVNLESLDGARLFETSELLGWLKDYISVKTE